MTLDESTHAYSDLARLHQPYIGESLTAAEEPGAPTVRPAAPGLAPRRPAIDAIGVHPSVPDAIGVHPSVPDAIGVHPSVPDAIGVQPSVPSPGPPGPNTPSAPSAQPVRAVHSAVTPSSNPGARRSQRALHKHAEIGPLRGQGGGETDQFDQLALMAEPENWSGRGATAHDPTWTLREYIEWTFERLYQQRKVLNSIDGGYSVFNSGLATRQQEPIYGLFTPNRNPDGPPWQLTGWYPESERGLHDHFPELPGFATYSDDPVDFVYDWRRELSALPAHLLKSQENLATLPDPLRENPYQTSLVLEGAVRRAKARARRSYRAAVPCWDPAAERVQLLLPLSLTNPETVDVALVVSRDGDGYRGHTILSLDIAYARARQLARVGEWLTAM